MERAVRILAALFATAAALILVALFVAITRHIAPAIGDLQTHPKNAALLGLGLGYGVMLLAVYSLSAWLLWKRVRWNMAMLLAIAACFGFPVGPVLGFAALILLTRPAVRAQFRS
jgi:hypothetical protein